MLANYLPDQNRFHLSGPPPWFLKALHDFDPSLVIVPSRQGFYYRLAQRRKLSLPNHIVNDLLFKESDTRMLASYSLVPVTTILATANWSNPYLFVELARRAPWRMGGAERVEQDILDQERKDELDKQAATSDYLTSLTKDGWNLYQKKVGLRTHGFKLRTKENNPPPSSPSIHL